MHGQGNETTSEPEKPELVNFKNQTSSLITIVKLLNAFNCNPVVFS